MITLYLRDKMDVFTGTIEVDPKEAMPARSTPTPPPALSGEQVAQWSGAGWVVLDSYPYVPAPAPQVPNSVSRFQARAALHQAGLLAQVQSIMEDPDTDPMTVIAWQDATEFRRESPTVVALADSLGLDDTALNDLFINAATIEA
ncbi:hypothetical protein [Vreelandella neptunia]|uniref:XRE family transcriptional regulator n=1 Tax=Vreelandella neptunia TaxID=115551 RepID=A0ABZ0YTR8_9GAMM|nr:hypothetical protein [Halomonas neptunia]MDN3561731.1 hypothetical protein [Halomonas neptunia]WQH14632.1 hypothetical protein SR894_08855 [Halomonas neptunia]